MMEQGWCPAPCCMSLHCESQELCAGGLGTACVQLLYAAYIILWLYVYVYPAINCMQLAES